MRGEYNLTEWEAIWWQQEFRRIINEKIKYELDSFSLVEKDINPYQVKEILEMLGWELVDKDIGYRELELWQYFENEEYPGYRVSVFSCGLTFDLSIDVYVKEEE